MSDSALPRLRARTRPISDPGDLLRFAEPQDPAVWLRRGDGIVGGGCLWRGEFQGESRIRDAREVWDAILAQARVEDAVRVPGSGLVAFGAFTFAASSGYASVLQIPQFIIGRMDGKSFLTELFVTDSTVGSGPVPTVPVRLPLIIPDGPEAVTDLEPGEMTQERHREAVECALSRIEQGEFTKIVISRDQHGKIEPDADRRHIVRRLANTYPETWTYAVDGLIGASPEMLVRVLGRSVTARVLAGTLPRGANEADDAAAKRALADSAKNRVEHKFAIDSAIESLRRLDTHDDPDTGLTASPEPFLLGLPNVWHLASDIRGTLPQGSSVLDLVEALHPTAAVGGTPRKKAMPVIDELEPFDRRRYAGPAGWLSASGDGEWVVALRGAEVDADGSVTAFAGGGIVAGSEAADEFAETGPKFRPITEALKPLAE
ncbi:isochorismate synthase [Gulosibacter chungangensis]|uniref:isochorismate synthase n=1 Tax=Gulosibacter chungangensis TaxID=979746 RepID=A0A7J5BHB5_9MICO|nr:isochorismate synthase [Gulosibacter chungangensis]